MRLECTRKLLDYLGIKPEKKADDIDPIFTWTANLITVNRRKNTGYCSCAIAVYVLDLWYNGKKDSRNSGPD